MLACVIVVVILLAAVLYYRQKAEEGRGEGIISRAWHWLLRALHALDGGGAAWT